MKLFWSSDCIFPNRTSAGGASSKSSQNNIFPGWFEEESRKGEEDRRRDKKVESRERSKCRTALGVERKEMRSVKDGAMRTV